MLTRTSLRAITAALWLAAGVCLPAQELANRRALAAAPLPSTPISLEDALNTVLAQGPRILIARKHLEAEHGIVVQTRAILLPKISISGNYSAVEPSDVDRPLVELKGFTFGSDQSWRSQVRLTQSIYEGGRMLSSLRSARLIQRAALLRYQALVSDQTLETRRTYYAVQLAHEQVRVQEASVQLLERELAITSRRFEAGNVPRFNQLRAEVELSNARPRLSRARNQLRIAKNNLANILGYSISETALENIPLELSTALDSGLPQSRMSLSEALSMARQQRPELQALDATRRLRQEDVVTAKAGYKPSLQGFFGYDAHSSLFSPDLTETANGWISGVQLQWNIFDGRLTQGRVMEATARRDAADLELDDLYRRIELEVRSALSAYEEAVEVLSSQRKAVEQAEEALRLASTRSEAGAGTQLDVLASQTALTEARSIHASALHDLALATARLEHATGQFGGREQPAQSSLRNSTSPQFSQ